MDVSQNFIDKLKKNPLKKAVVHESYLKFD